MPAKPQNAFERTVAELASTLGLRAEVRIAKGEKNTGVRLGCVPGKGHRSCDTKTDSCLC